MFIRVEAVAYGHAWLRRSVNFTMVGWGFQWRAQLKDKRLSTARRFQRNISINVEDGKVSVLIPLKNPSNEAVN